MHFGTCGVDTQRPSLEADMRSFSSGARTAFGVNPTSEWTSRLYEQSRTQLDVLH
jgi:hypothetical protein